MKYYAKTSSKRIAKKSLLILRKLLVKNKYARRVGKGVQGILLPQNTQNIYNISRYSPTISDYQKQLQKEKKFAHRPLISIIIPTYNTPIKYLKECIESVLLQSYSNWELCIADDSSSDKNVIKTIKYYQKEDKRIKLVERKTNGHISLATNSAISIAKGEFISLLDHDDVLWPNALYEIVRVLNDSPKADLIYTDEDKIDNDNQTHSYPFFKPDFSPEFLESCNYITHFSTFRTTLVNEIGGMRQGYEGAQDWDLLIRVAERTQNIIHIPKILYSWRIHEASTASDTDAKPYVYEAQRKLLLDHVNRTNADAIVKKGIIKQHSNIQYAVISKPKVSVIVGGGTTETLRKSIEAAVKCSPDDAEFIVLTRSKKEISYSKRILHKLNPIIIDTKNVTMARAYNLGVEKSTGEYVMFIEGTIVLKTKNAVDLLLGDAQREGVGVVGGKVLYRSNDRFLRAGSAAGIYGLYAPLLEGMPSDDIHYMRGLYAQSRRNTSIVDGYFMIKKEHIEKLGGFDDTMGDLFEGDLCLKLLDTNLRNIYNPFVGALDLLNKTAGDADMIRDKEVVKKFQTKWVKYIKYDPYFNPNFTRTNSQLDIR